MKRRPSACSLAAIVVCVLVTLALSTKVASAGANAGVRAYLSWRPTSQQTDTTAAVTARLYVRVVRDSGLTFKGAEIRVHWDPFATEGCFSLTGFAATTGTTCTYLNRGTSIPVGYVSINVADYAWSNTTTLTGCTSGAAAKLEFDVSECTSSVGLFCLDAVDVLDSQNTRDSAQIAGASATLGGGGGRSCTASVLPSTWGAVKAIYRATGEVDR